MTKSNILMFMEMKTIAVGLPLTWLTEHMQKMFTSAQRKRDTLDASHAEHSSHYQSITIHFIADVVEN